MGWMRVGLLGRWVDGRGEGGVWVYVGGEACGKVVIKIDDDDDDDDEGESGSGDGGREKGGERGGGASKL